MGVKYLFIFKLIIIILKYLINNIKYNINNMNYENRINEFNKYHYIIIINKKAIILGSSNDLNEALEITDNYIQKMLDHTEKLQPYLTSMKIDYP